MGHLGSYPEPVWFSPAGIANILSQNNVAKYYRLTMDSERDNAIIMHQPQQSPIRFAPSSSGLYCADSDQDSNIWVHINTVKGQADKYSKRAIKHAIAARKVQNITMRPSDRELMDIGIKHLANCPVTRADIIAARDILGPNLGSLKGKTVRHPNEHVPGGMEGVPHEIMSLHKNVTLCIDIMFINKIPFLVTISRNLKFRTVEALDNRQVSTICKKLQSIVKLYEHRGFKVTIILADPEFEPIRSEFPMLNCCGADEHIPDVERFIRTLKDRVRSGYITLPFKNVPRLLLIHLVKNSTLWLNAFPANDGVSSIYSPRFLLTGYELTFDKHVKLEFGSYVQTHEEHSNDMTHRTLGAICLGPNGNRQGGHYFMSLTSGSRITRHRWTELPMPKDVINRVTQMGREQKMPTTITISNRHGREIVDSLEEVQDDDSSNSSDSYLGSDEDDVTLEYDSDGEESILNQDDMEEVEHPLPAVEPVNEQDEPMPDVPEMFPVPAEDNNVDQNEPLLESDHMSINDESTGVGDNDNESDHGESTGVGTNDDERSVNVETVADDMVDEDVGPTLEEMFKEAEEQGKQAATSGTESRSKRECKPLQFPEFQYLCDLVASMSTTDAFCFMMSPFMDHATTLVTEQMSAKKGLKVFGDAGAEAIKKELEQLVYRKVMHGKNPSTLTREEKRSALKYLMFLKQKWCGRVKGRGCADGRKQRIYKTKEENSSPTISIESLFLTCIVDALEKRHVITCDIPGASMQAEMDEVVHVKLDGELAELLVKVDPSYAQVMVKEGNKHVIYAELDKALYGTLQAAFLFWKKIKSFFVEKHGFASNPYDGCVVNKMINGNQCTIGWHVDDIKLSHAENSVAEAVLAELEKEFGKEAPLTVTRGKVHEYLGMKIDFSQDGKVIFSMEENIEALLAEMPDDLKKGSATTPAANHLFTVNPQGVKLNEKKAENYHHLTAKLLYLCKQVRPDLQTAVSFLTTRVQSPDQDDYKKLGRCLRYLANTKSLPLTLEADGISAIHWWVDASFAVHPDMRSHTGATMTMGRGSPYSLSSKQKLNT